MEVKELRPLPLSLSHTVMCDCRLSSQFEFRALAEAWKANMGSFPSGREERRVSKNSLEKQRF